jgi:imidazolonepropionase-like amidohydrolase
MLTAPKGYGSLFVTSVEDARYKVEGELSAGADLIKFSMEDGYGGARDLPLLSTGEIEVIISTALAQGRRVSAHVTQAQHLQTVVEAGVDDAAHMVWDPIPESLLQQMVTDDVYVVPTLTVMEAYGALSGSQANLKRFVDAGGRVALGNDYTDIPQNKFDHFELGMPMHEIRRMLEAGLTPAQIVVAATRHAAHVCGLEKELGTLEPGKLADILVVDGDPLQDIQALMDVRLVIHNGVIIREDSR